jgi:hypothetical protein
MDNAREIRWRRGSRCETGSCVEIGLVSGWFLVRDSKDRDGPTLIFTRAEWQTFLEGVRAGDFDTPD